MDPRSANAPRRRIIRLIAAGAVVTPLGQTLLIGIASAADMVNEADPAAAALKDKADAAKAAERKDTAAFCDNCVLYTGKPGSPSGPCAALGNRPVAAKGWCNAWEGY